MDEPSRTGAFATGIWEWFARRKRVLPWRDIDLDDPNQKAYMILVSEVMLQQTQVPRVIVIFKNFLERFPTLQALAKASNKDVILAWRGMGYNSRALRLRDAAKHIVEDHGGHFPREMQELLAIKGIGPYTAAAIRNFAFQLPTPCLDTNIRRIIHRVFERPESKEGEWKKSDKQLLPLAERSLMLSLKLSPKHTGADWHVALMDFGSEVCTKRSPKCDLCPLNTLCKSAFRVPSITPGKRKMKKEPGRIIAGKFVPNRIVRGRIVEELRDAPSGLSLEQIGSAVCIDWKAATHTLWLKGLLDALVAEGIIRHHARRYRLAD